MSEPQKTEDKRLTPAFRAQAGKGRPKGVKNKTTLAMKEAISSVYADLQDESGEPHGHFKQWAKDNPTDFYKIAAKLIPIDVNANVTQTPPAYTVDDWLIPQPEVGHA